MNTKKIVKRLSAVGAGAIMLGATVMGAFAADLSDYPSMFVSEGTFNGYFVVGEAAASVDNLAMTDIATNMYYTSGDTTTTTTVEGDTWLAATSSNFLELGEQISSVESYLDDSQLGALADGEMSNAKGTAEYEQYLYFDEQSTTTAVTFQEDDEDNVAFMYYIPSGEVIARYVVDFTSNFESDVDSNSDFDDIEDEVITLLGREYTITEATNESGSTKLVLMGGAVSDTLEEGDVATYEISGVEYEVELLSVTATEAQFSINGETTSKLQDSETDVLDDGMTNIGVTDITYQDYAGGIHAASFFLGADKIELTDGSSMKVNEETINDAAVVITETYSGGDVAISEISINMTAEDDLYVLEGMKLSEATDLDEPEVLFTQNWDIELASVDVGTMEEVTVTHSESDTQTDLGVTLYDGDVSISVAYVNDTTDLIGGEKDGEMLRWAQYEEIRKNDFFFVHTADPSSPANEVRSYYLQYKGADATGDDNPKAYVKNMATGETLENSLDSDGTFDLRLGGVTFSFLNVTASASSSTDDFAINLTSDADGSLNYNGITESGDDTRTFQLRTADNHLVNITDLNATLRDGTADTSNWRIEVAADDTDKYDDATDGIFTVLSTVLSVSSGEVSAAANTYGTGYSNPDDTDITYYRSNYGEMLTATSDSSSPTRFDLSVPEQQAEVLLYVTSGATSSTSSVSGDLALVSVVDATRLDSEVADAEAQNLIVVGGPCVNTVAAELMGNPSDCAEGYTPGVAKVQLFEHSNGNVAMLVAGYSGSDTRLAGRVLAHRWDELSGTEVEIEGSTYSDATIAEASEASDME